MTTPNRIHLLPERDRMMAETYRQNADGSNNPTGAAKPADAPVVHRGETVNKVVTAPKADEPDSGPKATTKTRGKSSPKKG